MKHSPQFLKLVEDSKTRIREMDAPTLLRKIQEKVSFRPH